MRILSVSAEVAPFSKSGGLGDVGAALPAALAGRGHRVVTVSPAYRGARDHGGPWHQRGQFWFWLFGQHHQVNYFVWEASEHLAHVLLDNPMFDRDGLYHDSNGIFGDNQARFALLSRAALEVPRSVSIWGQPLGEVDILHAHDWHAALAPVFHNALYKPMGLYPGTRSVLTIHNAAHQGVFDPASLADLDLSARHGQTLLFGQALNSLKGGIVSSDMVTAVSPTFAQELKSPEGGFGLDNIFAQADSQGRYAGILNGIDTQDWDPATDACLPAHFSRGDKAGKARCKAALQAEMGLPVRDDVPLLGVVSRLDWQKGMDILLEAAPGLMERHDAQFVVLGSGDPGLEGGLRSVQERWPGKFSVRLAKDFPLARRIFAGSDFFLVPSLFEPCGLTQMYAMRYGAPPIVRATGGLRDSVQPWNPQTGHGNGWTFEHYSAQALAEAVGWAIHTFETYPEAMAQIQDNAMAVDWSWSRAGADFEALYQSLNPMG